jgi:hypothetical protein
LNEIRDKMWNTNIAPWESIAALQRILPKSPQIGSLAHQFLDGFPLFDLSVDAALRGRFNHEPMHFLLAIVAAPPIGMASFLL